MKCSKCSKTAVLIGRDGAAYCVQHYPDKDADKREIVRWTEDVWYKRSTPVGSKTND